MGRRKHHVVKAFKPVSNRKNITPTVHASKCCLVAVLLVLIDITGGIALSRAEQPGNDVPEPQVLTRGPVHEAFAGMLTFNPEPGIVVTRAPPEVIEEVPPEQKPEGVNVTWIPGYWAWDDERSDFLWVSGTWRTLPPGRQWMAGYWGNATQGYQWTSGYWADATARETTYLPPPPPTVEAGPNIAAPSMDYGWTPGCWIWYQGRYAWRPGYWALGRVDWDWTPAHYVWTPRGYIFVGGFWDYSVERRGVLFAPVYFDAGVYSRRSHYYSPTIVIDLAVFIDHLFLRPHYNHYYFGDYYAPSYYQSGFHASFSFQSGRYGYDPIYSHQRWEHRQDREWEHRVEASYQYRRDHETARPPRTWADQRNLNPSAPAAKENRVLVATSIDQLAKRIDSPLRFQPVAREERQKLAQRGQEVQKSSDQRRTLEAKAVETAVRKPGGVLAPAKATLPRSPIVATPSSQLGRSQTPPQTQRAPKPDLKFPPKAETPSRQPSVDRGNAQPKPRTSEPAKKPAAGRSEPPPSGTQVQGKSERQMEPVQQHTRAASQPTSKGLEREPQRVVKQATKQRTAESEKGATKLMKQAPPKKSRKTQPPPGNPPGL